MNKLLAASLFVFVCGCSSSPQLGGTQINFDVSNGFYEKVKLSTWTHGEKKCIKMVVNSPKFEGTWLPISSLTFEDESLSAVYRIALSAVPGIKTLNLISRDRLGQETEKNLTVIKSGIKYGEMIDRKFEFIESRTLKITGGGINNTYNLAFEPSSLFVSASSANSSVVYRGTCE